MKRSKKEGLPKEENNGRAAGNEGIRSERNQSRGAGGEGSRSEGNRGKAVENEGIPKEGNRDEAAESEGIRGESVRIAVNICTYKRRESIDKILARLQASLFFEGGEESGYLGALYVFVVDNAGELEEAELGQIRLRHNPRGNTGGSGGYQYGIELIRKSGIEFTHVVFMDDDVEFDMDCFYKLYDFLRNVDKDNADRPIAGRMIRMDDPAVQYTAAEVWNRGHIEHVGFHKPLSEIESEPAAEYHAGADYGGWWFGCYPYAFVRENDIMPFFLHCDDVEYGLRCGRPPIILKGVQVRHEAPGSRKTPLIGYYDTRNTLFVNERYGLLGDPRQTLKDWKENISAHHLRREWDYEYYVIRGMYDFLRGVKWLHRIHPGKYHRRLQRAHISRYRNSFFWRITEARFCRKYDIPKAHRKTAREGRRAHMRMRVYHFLVNRRSGIKSRYHRYHDGARGAKRLLSYGYLLWLNFCYYVLFWRSLDEPEAAGIYEEKKLPIDRPESSYLGGQPASDKDMSVESWVRCLAQYDVISFDVFDTLIFRPFSDPTDLFYILGEKLGILDFKRIRREQEMLARRDSLGSRGHGEVTLSDIWEHIERDMGVPAERGMAAELGLERSLGFGNPFMLEVYGRLQSLGKTVIAISDMYLPEIFLRELLEEKGYAGISKVYVSCEHGTSKAEGGLYGLAKKDFGAAVRLIHVGDNEESDVAMARRQGFDARHYLNVNQAAQPFRPYDMSPMVGGAYRGIVNSHLYCGLQSYSMEYEYGFIYGGLFVLGYCNFIHDYCQTNKINKILFLSRDGDILKQVYDSMYPEENTEYVYWSRKAAAKLEVGFHKADYFDRFIFQKTNQGYSLRDVLRSMGLEFLAEEQGLSQGRPQASRAGLNPEEELTDKNAHLLKEAVEGRWSQVLEAYAEENKAAKAYYEKVLKGVEKAAAVDVGWAGSGAVTLGNMVSGEWGIPCEIVGIVAGTNTVHNTSPDASEGFLQSGRMEAYLYSQRHNRDLLKKHDPGKGYNVFWEILLSSPMPKCEGFCMESPDSSQGVPVFGRRDANQDGIREIQRGIRDFAVLYRERFRDFPYMLRISGRDAYAPMLAASGRKEKYLRAMERKFNLEIHVN